ncbi:MULTISPECIES: hypothetical protein [Microbacterium]|uniref:hypothetical protein n=1 Tax=Microbacterium TaxID=33882 RepID=UPI0011EB0429|nr:MULTISPECIES: hypothetical protein [Microbacterium]
MVLLPSLVTDLETLLDVLDVTGKRWQGSQPFGGTNLLPIDYSFQVTSGEVTREELSALSVHERNSLSASVRVADRSLNLYCPAGHLSVSPENTPDVAVTESEAIRILLQGSAWRPTWHRWRAKLPLAPALLVLIGSVWLIASSYLPAAAVVALVGGCALLVAFAVQWSRELSRASRFRGGAVKFRAQSRQELYASRADRWANLKVALITAPVSILAALFIAWATGFISP